jgi:hypothetical protein
MGRAQALGGCQSLKNPATNQKTVLAMGGGGCLTRDANEGDGDKGGGQATAMRAMATATAMAMAMTWEMMTAMRLVVIKRERARMARLMEKVMRVAGDEEGKDDKAMAMATGMVGK